MAKVTAGAGYRELKRVGNYIAPQVNKGADRLAGQIAQQKQLDDDKTARAEKRLDSALKEADVDTDALQSKVTGFSNRDDIARDYAGTATERSMQYAQLAREAASSNDWKGHRANIDKMNAIKGDFKNAVNDEKLLGDLFGTYQTQFQEGVIDDDDWLDFLEAAENKDYEIGLDENDSRVITALVDDGNGGKKKVTKKMSDIVNGNERPFEKVPVSGKGGLIDEMLVGFGKRKYDTNTGNYVTTTQVWDERNEKAFDAKLNGLQSDDRTMYSLLKQASNGQIRKKDGFTDADKAMVEDYLYKQVKGQYDETSLEKVRSRTPEELAKEAAAGRAVTKRGQDLGQKKADDRLALDWWKAMNPNKKGGAQTETEMTMSRLHKDAEDFSSNSKPQVLNGTNITIDKKDYTVYDVLEPKGANYTTVYMKDSKGNIKKQNVPKTKRGFLDFKLQSPEYKNYSADKVLSQEPVQYQDLTPQMASEVQASFDRNFKDDKGQFNGNDDEFIAEMKEVYNLTDSEAETTIGFFDLNTVKIGDTEIDLDDKDSMLKVDRAIRKVKGLGTRATEVPEKIETTGDKPSAADLIAKYSN